MYFHKSMLSLLVGLFPLPGFEGGLLPGSFWQETIARTIKISDRIRIDLKFIQQVTIWCKEICLSCTSLQALDQKFSQALDAHLPDTCTNKLNVLLAKVHSSLSHLAGYSFARSSSSEAPGSVQEMPG